MRKITQISVCDDAIIALCNDGTLWQKKSGRSNGGTLIWNEWGKFEDIPQDGYKDEKVSQKPVEGFKES